MSAVVPPFTDPTDATASPANRSSWRAWLLVVAWLLACFAFPLVLSSCGGSDAPAAASTSASIGAAGGTLTGPDGVQLVVPAGALTQATTLSIARSANGAPPTTTVPNQTGPIYEFLPHGLVFDKPVTIRMPVPSGATGTSVLMASPGEDWQLASANVVNRMAEWQRNGLSWGIVAYDCAIPAGNTDPYPCSRPQGWASASAAPTSAIQQVMPGNYNNSAGSWEVNAANTVSLTMSYRAAPDCANPSIKLVHWNPDVPVGTPGRVQIVREQPVSLAIVPVTLPAGTWSGGGGVSTRGEGSSTVDVTSYVSAKPGTHAFGFNFSCQRPGHSVSRGGDLVTLIVNGVVAPPASFRVGGTVSGLTGAGLVLQNNGGDNLSLAADGGFNFATSVASGAAYAVAVQTQPVGQTCTVTNGSGTATADVANVAVSCSASGVTSVIQGYVNYTASGPVTLQNNGTDTITVRSDTSFSFPTGIAAGSAYNVTVLAAPIGQSCVVQRGSGTAPQRVGFEVQVDCTNLPPSQLALLTYSNLNSLRTFKLDATSGAPVLPSSNSTTGDYPLGVAVSRNRLFAYVSNLLAGTVTSYSIDTVLGQLTSTGSVAVAGPYAVALDPRSQFAWVVDNNNGQIRSFTVDSNTGALTASGAPASTGGLRPHSLAVSPDGTRVYVTNELSNSVSALQVDANTGALTLINTLANSVSAPQRIVIDPSGQFVYAATAGGNAIEVFQVNPSTGALAAAGSAITTTTPIDIAMHPSGSWLFVLRGGAAIRTFAIGANGALTDAGELGVAEGGASMAIDSAGNRLYLGVNGLTVFSINAATGVLTDTGFFDSSIGNTAPARIALTP